MGRFIEIALEILFVYLLYRLIFDFIIPVYRSSKKVHQQIREMQQRMQEQSRGQRPPPPPPPPDPAPRRVDGDDIELGEVKTK